MATAYGFMNLEYLQNTRISTFGVERSYNAIQESLAEYMRVMDALAGQLVEKTTLAMEQYELPGDGTLQPLTEDGTPLPVIPSGNYQVGYPIQHAGTAFGNNRIARALATVDELERFTADTMARDKDWMLRHVLAALFDNVSWTYNDKPSGAYKGLGNISIQPLANGDTVTYMRRGGSLSTDDHYKAQAAAIADATNPFPAIKRELVEHPGNGSTLVTYAPTALVDSVVALTEFVEVSDPDIRYGADNDVLESIRAEVLGPGDEVLGKTKSGSWVVEWGRLPATHMLTLALGSPKVLKMREYEADELKGLHSPGVFNTDGNHYRTDFYRYAGFGASNRVGAVVTYIGGASYTIPSGYDAPLAV
ncbi:MAG: hypothetical protein ACOYD4_06910 [Solirubrobacterales bacterium]